MAQRVVCVAIHQAADTAQGFPIHVQALGVLLRGNGEIQAAVAQALENLAGPQFHQFYPYPRVLGLEVDDAVFQTLEHRGQRGHAQGNLADSHVLDIVGLDLQATNAFHRQLGMADDPAAFLCKRHAFIGTLQ
ncbi:hypothetical protein D9M73_258350 [compost metagenome]